MASLFQRFALLTGRVSASAIAAGSDWRPPQRTPAALGLLRSRGADFLESAFRAILRRPPTPREERAYRHLMRRGMHPTEILVRLRFCGEGRAQGAPIRGLVLLVVLWLLVQIGWPAALLRNLRRTGRFVSRRRIRARRSGGSNRQELPEGKGLS